MLSRMSTTVQDTICGSARVAAVWLFTFIALSVIHCFALVSPAAAQANIGLYTDTSGWGCRFSPTIPGVITAYVVVRPDASGVTAVSFSVPIPPCLSATKLSEQLMIAAPSTGSSLTGISIGLGYCANSPVALLKITYQVNAINETSGCCVFPISEHPQLGYIETLGCAFQYVPTTVTKSKFTTTTSCWCMRLALYSAWWKYFVK